MIKDTVVKNNCSVLTARPCFTNSFYEADFASAVSCQVLYKKDAVLFLHDAFDARIASVPFGFFPNIGHRERKALRDQCREGNTGCFTTCHIVESFKPHVAQNSYREKIHQRAADARETYEFATVYISGAWKT